MFSDHVSLEMRDMVKKLFFWIYTNTPVPTIHPLLFFQREISKSLLCLLTSVPWRGSCANVGVMLILARREFAFAAFNDFRLTLLQ